MYWHQSGIISSLPLPLLRTLRLQEGLGAGAAEPTQCPLPGLEYGSDTNSNSCCLFTTGQGSMAFTHPLNCATDTFDAMTEFGQIGLLAGHFYCLRSITLFNRNR